MPRASTGETPYSLTFESEAVIPVDVLLPSPCTISHDEASNVDELTLNLDLIEELRNAAALRVQNYQQRIAWYYNARVKHRSYTVGSLVLRQTGLTQGPQHEGKLGPNWDGPYRVRKVLGPSTYVLE